VAHEGNDLLRVTLAGEVISPAQLGEKAITVEEIRRRALVPT
jgi:hypothetical protein